MLKCLTNSFQEPRLVTEQKHKSHTWLGVFLAAVLVFGWGLPAVSHADESAEQGATRVYVAGSDAGPDGRPVFVAASIAEDEINDPLEDINRAIFEFNEVLQDAFLRPITLFYNENFNQTLREGISNFLDNLSSPIILANDLLQGEFERALITFGRAFINTTVGIGGIADVATELGIERHEEDFGQTLGTYGVGEGFYLVLPVFGPSNPRDALGKFFVDSYFDPVGLWMGNTGRDEASYALLGADGLDEYAGIVEELNQVKKTSVDYYAAIRSLYRQKRKTEINNGSTLELLPIPDLGYNLEPKDFDQSLAGVTPPAVR